MKKLVCLYLLFIQGKKFIRSKLHKKKVISKSKIHNINIMLTAMLKLTNPNNNPFPTNAMAYLIL